MDILIMFLILKMLSLCFIISVFTLRLYQEINILSSSDFHPEKKTTDNGITQMSLKFSYTMLDARIQYINTYKVLSDRKCFPKNIVLVLGQIVTQMLVERTYILKHEMSQELYNTQKQFLKNNNEVKILPDSKWRCHRKGPVPDAIAT